MSKVAEKMPVCVGKSDCFANFIGKCSCLSDTKFKNRKGCPFYKTRDKYFELQKKYGGLKIGKDAI